MFRAIWIWVWSPVWEVRIVSTTTGKDIPGRCVYKGTYWKARKQFKKTKGKYGNMIRLQAVIRADWRMNETRPDLLIVDEATDVPRETYVPIVEGNHPRDLLMDEPVLENPMADGMPEFMTTRIEGEFPKHDIGEANARQSEFMEKHQDEPNVYQGEDHGDHACNEDGPMECDAVLGIYMPTCTICGALENV